MQKTEKNARAAKAAAFIAAAALVLAAGLALAARYDLSLNLALRPLWEAGQAAHAAGQRSVWYTWGILAECLGPLPAYAAAVLVGWGLCAETRRTRRSRTGRLLAGVLLVLGGMLAAAASMAACLKRRQVLTLPQLLVWGVGLLAGAAVLAWALCSRISAADLRRWRALSLLWAAMDVGQLAVVNLLKLLWQRTRFDDLLAAGDLSGFTHWLQAPGGGGSSFPSGHTASAGVLLVLVFACRLFDSCKGDEAGFLFVGYGFTGAVAFGRLLIGRHYLADTLAAIAIDSLLLAALWFAPPVKRWLARVTAVSPGPGAVPPEKENRLPPPPKKQPWRRPATVQGGQAQGENAAPKKKGEPS